LIVLVSAGAVSAAVVSGVADSTATALTAAIIIPRLTNSISILGLSKTGFKLERGVSVFFLFRSFTTAATTQN
jgi:hypothetical protein